MNEWKKPLALGLLFIGVCAAFALSMTSPQSVEAATTYTVHNVPVTTLKYGIDATATSGIRLNPPSRNGVDVSYPTISGGILEFTQPGKIEYIYYSKATVDSDLMVTLTGSVVRGYCWNENTFASCEAGQRFDAGAKARLIFDMRLINNSIKSDSNTQMTESGAIECASTNQGCISVGNYTTAQIDAFTYNKNSTIVVDTTRSVPLVRIGDAWVNMTGTGSENATNDTRGVSEFAELTEHQTRTGTGATGARLSIWAAHLISSSATYYPASVTYGSGATSTPGSWSGITDGEFHIVLNLSGADITGIDFAGATDMDTVAERIEGRLNEVVSGTGHTVTWTGSGTSTGFTITTSNTTSYSSGSNLSAVSWGGGTDISGAGATSFMDGDDGSANVITHHPSVPNHPIDAWKVPMLNADGFVGRSIGGTGTGSFNAGTIMIGAGTGAATQLAGAATGHILGWNEDSQKWESQPTQKEYNVVYVATARETKTDSGAVFTTNAYTIGSGSLSVGDSFTIRASFLPVSMGGVIEFEVGGDDACRLNGTTMGSSSRTEIDILATVRTIGTTGTIFVSGTGVGNTGLVADGTELTVNTATPLLLQFREVNSASDLHLDTLVITKLEQ